MGSVDPASLQAKLGTSQHPLVNEPSSWVRVNEGIHFNTIIQVTGSLCVRLIDMDFRDNYALGLWRHIIGWKREWK